MSNPKLLVDGFCVRCSCGDQIAYFFCSRSAEVKHSYINDFDMVDCTDQIWTNMQIAARRGYPNIEEVPKYISNVNKTIYVEHLDEHLCITNFFFDEDYASTSVEDQDNIHPMELYCESLVSDYQFRIRLRPLHPNRQHSLSGLEKISCTFYDGDYKSSYYVFGCNHGDMALYHHNVGGFCMNCHTRYRFTPNIRQELLVIWIKIFEAGLPASKVNDLWEARNHIKNREDFDRILKSS